MKRTIRAVFAFGFIAGIGATLGVSRVVSKDKNQAQAQTQTQTPATLTPQQIEDIHSRLFFAHQWQLDKEGKRIPEIPRQLGATSGDIYLRNIPPAIDYLEADSPTRFAQFACFSDLVVLGTAGTGISHLTSDKSFLYTDWEFSVERVFKNNSSAPVQAGSRITLVAPGGTLQIDGRTIHATEYAIPESGRQYVILLVSVPKTGAYTSSDGFLISRDAVAARGAFANTVDTRGIDAQTLFKLMDDGVSAATHTPNCKGAAKK
jgi:hypothetical protein